MQGSISAAAAADSVTTISIPQGTLCFYTPRVQIPGTCMRVTCSSCAGGLLLPPDAPANSPPPAVNLVQGTITPDTVQPGLIVLSKTLQIQLDPPGCRIVKEVAVVLKEEQQQASTMRRRRSQRRRSRFLMQTADQQAKQVLIIS